MRKSTDVLDSEVCTLVLSLLVSLSVLARCGLMSPWTRKRWAYNGVAPSQSQTWRYPNIGEGSIGKQVTILSCLLFQLPTSNSRTNISPLWGKSMEMRGTSWCGGFPIPAGFPSSEPSAEAPSAREQTERCISKLRFPQTLCFNKLNNNHPSLYFTSYQLCAKVYQHELLHSDPLPWRSRCSSNPPSRSYSDTTTEHHRSQP